MDPHHSGAHTGRRKGSRDESDALWDWNLESDRIHFSPEWLALIGCEEEEVGRQPDDWFRRVHPDDSGQFLRDIEDARAGDSTTFACRYRLRHKDGTYRWMSCRGTVVRDGAGQAIRLTGSQSDITVEMVTDPLTGLPNQLLLRDRVTHAIERARRHQAFHFAVLLIDLGRPAGARQPSGTTVRDPLLTAVARRLESCLRVPGTVPNPSHNDLVARMDGDSFAVLLDGLRDIGHAKTAADRILAEIVNPFALGGREVRLSPSIGVAVSATGYTNADQMMRDAQAAQHRARVLGGSHCEMFDTAILKSEQAELQLEGDFEAALQRREFVLFFQPIVSLASNGILGFEALVRWQHPILGTIAPLDFIPLAERTGFIVPLGNWILREACLRLSEWQIELPQSTDVYVSVNVSSVQWSDPALVDQIGEALRDSCLEPRRLVLELTEGIAMANPAAITTLLMRLRAMGVRISVDDFGTGYSSLAYLRQFPIDTLKIDRSFVRGMVANKDTAEIVAGLMNMAQQLGLHVVAEGIEHEDQCRHLRALKCDAGQGYLFATPLDATQATEVLKTGLAPRLDTGSATASGWRESRIPQLLLRGRFLVAGHRVSFAVAALALLLSAALVGVVGRIQPVRGGSPASPTDAQQPPIATHTPHALPIEPTWRVVQNPSGPSVTEREAPGARSSVSPLLAAAAPTTTPGSSTRASAAPMSSAISRSSPAVAPIASTSIVSLEVVHLHRLGKCHGRLDVNRDGVAFVSDSHDSDEAFTLKYAEFVDALADDTLTLRSAKKTYRFKAARSDAKAQLRDVADGIARSRR
jgi:diguanylate cyclase (GGDEF)-like protein/PAS domain S-box-containing protein